MREEVFEQLEQDRARAREEKERARREEREEQLHHAKLRAIRSSAPSALPPPPPVAIPSRSATTTFDQSKTFLPAAAIKTLRAQAPPLADEAVPEPQCLRSFWERAYAAI
jgi:hypothetical protein